MKVEIQYIGTKIIEIDDDSLKGLDDIEIGCMLSEKIGIQADDILYVYDENDKCIIDWGW